MRTNFLLTLAAGLGVLTVLTPAASAKPPLCTASVIEQTLIGAGKLTAEDVEGGIAVSLIRCGDVTDDGASDVVFTLASGGTAGDTRFGVIEGGADGAGEVVLFKQGYKVGIARHDSDSFDVLQPHYGKRDANCCPSSFRQTRFTWTGARFKAGKAKKLRSAPARFYRRT
jgi:hypothetical protein